MNNPYKDMDYAVYLTTVHWEKLRERKLIQADHTCEKCPRHHGLEVHHLTYVRLGEELLDDLQVLCAICHREAHDIEPTANDWRRARFVYGSETLEAHAQMLKQRWATSK